MKTRKGAICLMLALSCNCLIGQYEFIYDQQSSTNEFVPSYGSGGAMLTIPSPWGQSFTPVLNSVEFIRLKFNDGNRFDGLGATVYLNLRSDSMSGAILGTTDPVTMPSQFRGTEDFFFAGGVTVTTGVIYYFEVVEQSGGAWNIDGFSYHYPGGMFFYNGGTPLSGSDLWFREGIVIPEPAAGALLWLGLAGLLTCRWARSSPQAL